MKIWVEEQTLKRNANILLVITCIIMISLGGIFLWLPRNMEKNIYGIVIDKNQIQTYLTKEDLNVIQNWDCGKKKCDVIHIAEQIYRKEDGKSYYLVTIYGELTKEENHKNNYVIYKISKKESKYQQIKQWIRSVMW